MPVRCRSGTTQKKRKGRLPAVGASLPLRLTRDIFCTMKLDVQRLPARNGNEVQILLVDTWLTMPATPVSVSVLFAAARRLPCCFLSSSNTLTRFSASCFLVLSPFPFPSLHCRSLFFSLLFSLPCPSFRRSYLLALQLLAVFVVVLSFPVLQLPPTLRQHSVLTFP